MLCGGGCGEGERVGVVVDVASTGRQAGGGSKSARGCGLWEETGGARRQRQRHGKAGAGGVLGGLAGWLAGWTKLLHREDRERQRERKGALAGLTPTISLGWANLSAG